MKSIQEKYHIQNKWEEEFLHAAYISAIELPS